MWGQVKRRVGKQLIKSKADLKARVIAALRSLQKLPNKIRGFFQARSCQYGAAE
ncbi:MAG: hypothetical protein U9P00_06520 [Pseudomonadota bacterium]|nr:hypothetical protein [Pseudomonadota bacterium]